MKKSRGSILVTVLVGTMIFAILSVGALSATLSIHSRAQKYKNETQAYYTALSVAEFFAAQISDGTADGEAILSAALASGSASISGVSLPDTMGECDLQISCEKQSFTVNAEERTIWELTMKADSKLGEATSTATVVMRNFTGNYEVGSGTGGSQSIDIPSLPPGEIGKTMGTIGRLTVVSTIGGDYYIANDNQNLRVVSPLFTTGDMIYIIVRSGTTVHLDDVLAGDGLFGGILFANTAVVSIIVEDGAYINLNSNSGSSIYTYLYLLGDDPEGQLRGNVNRMWIVGGLYASGRIYETSETFKDDKITIINRFGNISWSDGLPEGVTISDPSIIRYE